MIAYKMMKLRKDNTLGPLFIDASLKIRIGETHVAKQGTHKKGYKYRPGFHCCLTPHAPHLKLGEGRVWVEVLISDYTEEHRPMSQGGTWYLANRITFLKFVPPARQKFKQIPE